MPCAIAHDSRVPRGPLTSTAFFALLVLGCALVLPSPTAASFDDAIQALKVDGRVILMRHTQTVPGVGDPSGFQLEECSTQRNLNELGIEQARSLGAALRNAGIRIGRVLVSQWCRADDTARFVLEAASQGNASQGKVKRERLPALNNVWDDDSRIDQQVAEIRAAIGRWQGPGILLMVSHGVTIRPVTGQSAPQGGFFVLQPNSDGFSLIAEGAL